MAYVPPLLFPKGLTKPSVTLSDQFYQPPFRPNESDGPSGAPSPDYNTPEAVAAGLNQTVANQQRGLTSLSPMSLAAGAVPGLGTMMTLATAADWANKNRSLDLLNSFTPDQISAALGAMSPAAAAQAMMGGGPGVSEVAQSLGFGDPTDGLGTGGITDVSGMGGPDGSGYGADPGGGVGSSPSNSGHGDDPAGFRVGGYIPNKGAPRLDPKKVTAHEGEFVLRPEAVKKLGLPFLTILNALGTGNGPN